MAKGFVIRKRDFPQAWGWISGMYKLYTGTNKNPVFVQGADVDIKDFLRSVIFQIELDYDNQIDTMFDFELKRELTALKSILRDL